MKNKWIQKNIEHFYEGYFAQSSKEWTNTYEEDFEEYLSDTDKSKEDPVTEEAPKVETVHEEEFEEEIEQDSIDWNDILPLCSQEYQEEKDAQTSVFRTTYKDEKLSQFYHNMHQIELFCNEYHLSDGAYYLCEMYRESKNIHKNLLPIYRMIAYYDLSNEEIILLLEARMTLHGYTTQPISWDSLAQLLIKSNSIPSIEEFRGALDIALERQKKHHYFNVPKLLSDFEKLINTQLYF